MSLPTTVDAGGIANSANEEERHTKSVPKAYFAVALECDTVQTTLRTYILTASLLLGPSVLSVANSLVRDPRGSGVRLRALKQTLSKELGSRGLPFALALAVGGGQSLKTLWEILKKQPKPLKSYVPTTRRLSYSLALLQNALRAFAINVMASGAAAAILLYRRYRSHALLDLHSGTKSSTLDLTLWLLVHALDSLVQSRLLSWKNKAAPCCMSAPMRDALSKERIKFNAYFDGFLFWASSARHCPTRIMWCFFYEPQRLPRSYAKWINRLARIDWRLLELLRAVRQGNWSYIHGSDQHKVASSLATDLGYPTSWGNPKHLPARGRQTANKAWMALGVSGRDGVGGLPCQLVHGRAAAWFGLDDGCSFIILFNKHVQVYFGPLLLTRPGSILHPDSFLSAFISSYWFTVCMTRTLVLARLLPNISHDTWDGPFGCTLLGALPKRRGDMALYVFPKGLRASIPNSWIKSPAAKFVERATFTLSMATLLTTAVYSPDALRGLAGWIAAFIVKGPKITTWRRRKQSTIEGVDKDVEQSQNVRRQ
ncbi:hypothetical protein EDD17DRAFT_1776995 [Pisolithus thermaeus]|nr:hypothetical protein EDD17DRAFT_1776995 [Pisolithus thermaeus]